MLPKRLFFQTVVKCNYLLPDYSGETARRALAPMSFDAPDRVASGRCRPEAPTDPYLLALEHTVPQIMVSLLYGKPNVQCARGQVENAGAVSGTDSS